MRKLLPDQAKNEYRVIGLMSGTSLDGVDLACCRFTSVDETWHFQIEHAETIPYPEHWLTALPAALQSTALDYAALNANLGSYYGGLVREFIFKHQLQADFVASHGHTVFHQPSLGFTAQIGSGASLAAGCGLPVVCDFRSTDVAHGGQGAPLVPLGDALLFSDYRFCLNLGGFSNVSYKNGDQRIAYDISPVNTLLNQLVHPLGLAYDRDGLLAREGQLDPVLLSKLNALSFYHTAPPKSLGFEWNNREVWPLLHSSSSEIKNLLRTVVEHVAIQLSAALAPFDADRVLVTGGGAKNRFLIERFAALSHHELVIPEKTIIDYKEALIFAFLGLRRVRGEVNCLCSVTGADQDVVGGCIYLP